MVLGSGPADFLGIGILQDWPIPRRKPVLTSSPLIQWTSRQGPREDAELVSSD
jgi:hypothetical protein